MNQPTNQPNNSAPWLLIVGLVLGGGLLAAMAWEAFPTRKSAPPSPNVIELTNASWEAEVIRSKVPVLVDFSAEWCRPCQEFAPTIDKLAARYKGKAKICRFDVGNTSFHKATKLADEYNIRSIPLLLVFKDGELRDKFEGGNTTETQLANSLDRVLR